jgi:hypothetical protein
VYPIVFLCTIALLFFSLWSFERAYLQQIASVTADRAAYNWEHSGKDPLTGAFDIHQQVGLYWRIGSDNLGQSTSIELPVNLTKATLTGVNDKLHKAAALLPAGINGKITYSNSFIGRKVEVQLARMITPVPFLTLWFGNSKTLFVRSSASVIEPVEFIRNTNLVINYLPLLKGAMTDKEADEVIKETTQSNSDQSELLLIRSEAEASQYIQKLVHGHTVVMSTQETGESRKIDALDPDGIAHEAKYTVNLKQAHQEILKDVELIRNGVIKGAVWHFFRNQKTGQIGLTGSLRKDLEEHGIIVVVHN